MFKIGSLDLAKVLAGNSEISSIFVGADQVYTNASTAFSALLYTLSESDIANYARSTAISVSYTAIGNGYTDHVDGNDSGAVFIYDNSDGSLVYTLINPNDYETPADDHFGSSVAICGNYIAVGAKSEGDADDSGFGGSGKAYIYSTSTGNLLHTLDNPNAYGDSTGDYFGESIGVTNTYTFVGASDEDSPINSGRVYVFNSSSGSLVGTITNPTTDPELDEFGTSLAVDDNYLVVGSPKDSEDGSESGSVGVFDTSTRSLEYIISNPNDYGVAAGDSFGNSVGLSTSYVSAGAWKETDSDGNTSGKAYLFNSSDGTLLQTFENPNIYGTTDADYFGYSIDNNESYTAVSAVSEDSSDGSGSGVVYIFDNTTGNLVDTIVNPGTNAPGDYFGYSVSMSSSQITIGSYRDENVKAYIYSIPTT